MKLVEVKDLKFSYDKKNTVLDGVSFSIESGKYYSIIGHNGSGKSTIAKLLVGLLDSGEKFVTAFDLFYTSKTIPLIRSKIGIVFQNPDNQFVGSTVRDDIAFGLENRQVPHDEMDKIIEKYAKKVHMEEFLDKEPENLSGGQKQRVAIAGVLAMNPEIIILDEATSMLDPKGKKEVKETIDELRKENPNLTVISITHDLEEAFSSDEIIVLNKGKVLLSGNPAEIATHHDELLSAGLDLPFKEKLVFNLNKLGITVNNSGSLEEIVEELCQ